MNKPNPIPIQLMLTQLVRKIGVAKLHQRLIRYKCFAYTAERDIGEFAIGERTPTDEQIVLLAKALPRIKASLEAAEEKAFQNLPPPEYGR